MNKVHGLFLDFSYVREGRTRIVVSYNLEQLEDGVHATWNEIYFYKKQHPVITLQDVKDAIIGEINTTIEEKIKSSFEWKDNPVWLSIENQFDFKAAYDLAVQTKGKSLPVTLKLGETTDGESVYYIFDELKEFTDFYTKFMAFINTCLAEGRKIKDAIEWENYKTDKIQ